MLNILLWLLIAIAICIVYFLLRYGPRRLANAVRWRAHEIAEGKYWGRERPAEYYDAKYAAPYDSSRYEPIYEQVIEWLDDLDSPMVLEVGSGTGVLAERIVARRIAYHGFDFSGVAVRTALERVGQAVFAQADAYDPASYSGHFNTVILIEVLEHLDDLRVLQCIPAGVTVIVSVPNYRDPGHVRTYQSEAVIRKRYSGHLAIDQVLEYPVGGKSKLFLFKGTRLQTC